MKKKEKKTKSPGKYRDTQMQAEKASPGEQMMEANGAGHIPV